MFANLGMIATNTWNSVTGFAQAAWDRIYSAFDSTFVQPFLRLGGSLESATAFFASLPTVISNAWAEFTVFASDTWDEVCKLASNTWDEVKRLAGPMWDEVKRLALVTWEAIKAWAIQFWANLPENAANAIVSLINFLISAYETFNEWLMTAWEGLLGLFLDGWVGYVDMLFNAFDWVIDQIPEWFEWALNHIPELIGVLVFGPFIVGFEALKLAWNVITRVAERIWPTIVGFAERMWTRIANFAVSIWNRIWNAITAIIRRIPGGELIVGRAPEYSSSQGGFTGTGNTAAEANADLRRQLAEVQNRDQVGNQPGFWAEATRLLREIAQNTRENEEWERENLPEELRGLNLS